MHKKLWGILFILGNTGVECSVPVLCLSEHVYEIVPDVAPLETKEYTVAVYIAARNELAPYVLANLHAMMRVGSTDNLTIVVHLDSIIKNNGMRTQRFIVYKDKIVQVGELPAMDSGHPDTLIDFCRWAFTQFPCRQPMLMLWSHGMGDLEIENHMHALDASHLRYHGISNLLSGSRSVEFNLSRGICFDDITGHALTNHEVGHALALVRDTCLGGEPFACVLCDACLMQSIGFMYSMKPHGKKPVARLLIGSQEAVFASGYDYYRTLLPLSRGNMPLTDFATHVVNGNKVR